MKARISILTIVLFIGTLAKAQHVISVTIQKLENSEGLVMVELVDDNNEVVGQKAERISGRQCTFTFEDIASGQYAIRYYHDENENGKMDTGNFGIPKEGYGFSNNARGFMGPPDFEDMIFEVNGNIEMSMKTVN